MLVLFPGGLSNWHTTAMVFFSLVKRSPAGLGSSAARRINAFKPEQAAHASSGFWGLRLLGPPGRGQPDPEATQFRLPAMRFLGVFASF